MRRNALIAKWFAVLFVTLNVGVIEAGIVVIEPKTLAPELFQSPQRPDFTAELQQAVKAFQAGEQDKAYSLLRAASEKYPELPPTRLMLARLFLYTNQLPQTHAVLEQAAAERADHPGVYIAFGFLALAEDHLTDGMVHFEKASSLAKSDRWSDGQKRFFRTSVLEGLATVAERRNNWSSAILHLSAWLKIDPKNAKLRERRAEVLFYLNKRQEAYSELKRASGEDRTLLGAEINMGLLFLQTNDLEQATEWMQTAVRQHPKDARAHLELGTCLLRRSQLDEASAHADIADKLDRDSKELKILRGMIALQRKDYKEAERQYQALYEQSPDDFVARNQLALSLAEQTSKKKRARALELAELNARLFPRAAEAISTLGRVYYHLGRIEDSERQLKAALSSGFARPDTAYYLAQLLHDRDQNEGVEQLLRSALTAQPGSFVHRDEAQQLLARVKKSQ